MKHLIKHQSLFFIIAIIPSALIIPIYPINIVLAIIQLLGLVLFIIALKNDKT